MNEKIRVNCSYCGGHAFVKEVYVLNFCSKRCAEGFNRNVRELEDL